MKKGIHNIYLRTNTYYILTVETIQNICRPIFMVLKATEVKTTFNLFCGSHNDLHFLFCEYFCDINHFEVTVVYSKKSVSN